MRKSNPGQMDQVLPYFKEAHRLLLADDFPDAEARGLLVQNVFVELDGKEVRLCCHPDGSRIVETLLRSATNFQLRVFWDRLAGAAFKLATNRYASHCLEVLIEVAQTSESDSLDEQELPSLEVLRDRFLAELSVSLPGCISHPQGSHVLRRLMGAAKGSPEHAAVISRLTEALSHGESDWPYETSSSAFLQAVMNGELAEALLSNQPGLFARSGLTHKTASHLVECMVGHLPAAKLNELYRRHLKSHLASLIEHAVSMHVVKAVIKHAPSLPQFKLILDDLSSLAAASLRPRLSILNAAVVWLNEHQQRDAQTMQTVFKLICEAFAAKTAAERKQLPRLLLGNDQIDRAGAFLLNQLLQWPEEVCRPLIDGLLEFEAADLVQLACHPAGSLAIQPVFDRQGPASEKARLRLYRRLLGHYATLSIDRHGSHLVDACWQGAPAEVRTQIVQELAAAKTRLMDSPHGRLILRNCRVEEWQRQKEGWEEAELRAERRKILFADLIEDEKGDDADQGAGKEESSKKEKNKKRKKVKGEDGGLLLEADIVRPQLEL